MKTGKMMNNFIIGIVFAFSSIPVTILVARLTMKVFGQTKNGIIQFFGVVAIITLSMISYYIVTLIIDKGLLRRKHDFMKWIKGK
jgi:hypothetical protein